MSVHPILPLFFVGGDFLFIYGCMGGDDGCTGRMAVCSGKGVAEVEDSKHPTKCILISASF